MNPERIKPTHKPIKEYYATLAGIQKTGAKHETALRTAFQHLMEKLARQRGWVFVPERAVVSEGHRVVPDGTLLDEHHIPRGHWEAKDLADDLDAEIARKKSKGYPLYNITFEDGSAAVLSQNGHSHLPSKTNWANQWKLQ